MKWIAVLMAGLLIVVLANADGEIWEEDEHEVLIRSERGAKNKDQCRYIKGSWTECDTKTNMRSRTLTLKKGDRATCELTKTIQKKCKKANTDVKGLKTSGECSAFSTAAATSVFISQVAFEVDAFALLMSKMRDETE